MELQNLYSVLSFYMQSLTEVLQKIDENLLQAVNSCGAIHTKDNATKKYKISLEMMSVLQSFIKMLYMSENLADDLVLKLSKLDQDSQPERGDRRMSNPFVLSLYNEPKEVINSSFYSHNRSETKVEEVTDVDAASAFTSDSEAETIVGIPVQQVLKEEGAPDEWEEFILHQISRAHTPNSYNGVPESETPQQDSYDTSMCLMDLNIDNIVPEKTISDLQFKNVTTRKIATTFNNIKMEKVDKDPLGLRKEPHPVNFSLNNSSKDGCEGQQTTQNRELLGKEIKIEQISPKETRPEISPGTSSGTAEPYKKPQDEVVKAKNEKPQVNKITPNIQNGKHQSEKIGQNYSNMRDQVKDSKDVSNLGPLVVEQNITNDSGKESSMTGKASPKKPRKNESVTGTTSHKKDVKKSSEMSSSRKFEESENVKALSGKTHTELVSNQNAKSTEYTALIKLLGMSVHDRRREAEKKYENKSLDKNFKWTTASPPKNSSPGRREGDKKYKEKIAIFDISDDFLAVGHVCTFSYVKSPSEFYLRTNEELFESLENSLNEDMNTQHQWVVNKFKSKNEARTHLGNFCLGFLQKRRKWFRIKVIDWMTDEPDSILVQLIDYGEMLFWRYENLKGMTEFYSKFPRMSIKCHLSGILPPDVLQPSSWPQCSVDALIELTSKEKFVTIFVYKEGDSYGVDLINEKDQFGRTLGQVLIDNELASEIRISDSNFLETISEEDLDDYENITEAIAGYDAKDEARICPFTDSTGRCFKGPGCKLDHTTLSKDGITTDKILTMNQALTKTAFPAAGNVVDIMVTGYINTCHFYAHIITNRTKNSNCNEDFRRLRETMKSNNLVQSYEMFKVFPGVGELVLLKEGLEWFRGSCVGYSKDDSIEIFLVDFGFKRTKKFKELRQMREDFLHVPFQAVECILNDCQEKKEATREASLSFFTSCMKLQTFRALVIDSSEPLRLQMWDSSNMDMHYVLKQCGLGQDRDRDVFPAVNGILSCN